MKMCSFPTQCRLGGLLAGSGTGAEHQVHLPPRAAAGPLTPSQRLHPREGGTASLTHQGTPQEEVTHGDYQGVCGECKG